MKTPNPIPRAELDRVTCLCDLAKATESEFLEAWNAIPLVERQNADFDTARLGGEIAALSDKRDRTAINSRQALNEIAAAFPWFWPSRSSLDDAGVTRDYQEALLSAWQYERRDRIAALVAAWNPLKGFETTNPPVSGWALNVKTQQAFKILRASPTGRKVRAVGVDGEVIDLKPCVIHGSGVGSCSVAPTRGGWVSCSEVICEMVWELKRDRDEFFAKHPAII